MWARKLAIFLILLLFISSVQSQQEKRSVLLPVHELKSVSDRYSSDRSEKYDGTWEPTKADLDGLEKSLPQVSKIKIFGWATKIHIEHPELYYRQYVAVLVAGKKMIFVNAFRYVQEFPQWRDRLVLVHDGDLCFWQALYDPATMRFSNLRINARA
jgi:hypothetical protein